MTTGLRETRTHLDAIEVLFLGGAVLAPLDLRLVGSMTVYDLIIAGIAVLLLLLGRRFVPLPTLFLPAVFVFLLFGLMSAFRAARPEESLTQVAQFAFIWLVQLPVVLTVVRTRRMLNLSLAMLAVGSLAGVLVSFVAQQAAGAGRIVAFYSDNPNRLGYPTAYLLPFVLYYLGVRWRPGQRQQALLLGGALLYFMIWALAAAGSRGGASAALVSFCVYVVFCDGFQGRGRRLLLTALCLVAGYVLLFSTSLFPATLEERVNRSFSAEEAERADLLQDRELLAVAAIRAVQDSPFVGTGLDNFRYVAQRYEARATAQAPHNMWLAMLAQVGVVGTIAFAFFIVTWFELLLRARARAQDRLERRLAWAFITSMIAVMLIFTTTPIMIHRHYWLLYALGLSFVLLPPKPAMPPATASLDAR